MTTTGWIVAALAVLLVLACIAWTTRRTKAGSDAAEPVRGRGLLDELATAIEDIANQFLSLGSRRH